MRITSATLAHVHTSPRKPYASAPRSRSSGTLARCSSLRRGAAPGGGLCLKPCTPSSLARFIHWLTAPSVTPRASAICVCFQPRSFSSKARKRLPSRQSLAWLDNVLSIVEFIIPTSLGFYAEISRSFDPIRETGCPDVRPGQHSVTWRRVTRSSPSTIGTTQRERLWKRSTFVICQEVARMSRRGVVGRLVADPLPVD